MYEARYQDGAGRELRLFVAPDPGRYEELLHRIRKDGRRIVYWKQGPLMYALTGDFNQHDLDGFADKAINRFQERFEGRRYARTGDEGATIPAGDQPADQPPPGVESPVEKSLDTSRLVIENDIDDSAPAANQAPQVNY